MNLTSIIREIEHKYDVENILSNNIPIWQFLRNIIFDQGNDIKKINNIKKIYYLLRNKNWGNYSVSQKHKYVLFSDLREEIFKNNLRID